MNLQQKVIENIGHVLFGKKDAARLATACFFSEGHLLIDDIPGVGKTTLALSLSKSLGMSFQRIQFTSDLLPSDLLGVSIFNPQTKEFEFKKGPVFHHIVLADEINRASPKTQSALLEAMQEGQISMDAQTHALPRPFFVIATQNPHDHHGTFPLPESQLDRFTMKINLGYPDAADEAQILRGDANVSRVSQLESVTTAAEVQAAVLATRTIRVDASLDRYMVELAHATRESPLIDLGLSPRGTLALRRAAQAYASTFERDYVIPDDVKAVAAAVMAHRLRLKGGYFNGASARSAEAVIQELLGKVPVPS